MLYATLFYWLKINIVFVNKNLLYFALGAHGFIRYLAIIRQSVRGYSQWHISYFYFDSGQHINEKNIDILKKFSCFGFSLLWKKDS